MIWHHHETIIRDLLLQRGLKRVVEIGVAYGVHTRMLVRALKPMGGHLTSIDPRIPWRLRLRVWRPGRIRFIEATSLEALPRLASAGARFDCAIIDGDHNWYTVFNELELLAPMMSENAIMLLHDVAFPYGRRDLYYAPERIPAEFTHPYARRPIVEGQSELGAENTPGMNPNLFNALHEGGPRNGVLTAAEDFVAAHPEVGWRLRVVQSYGGLGILERDAAAANQQRSAEARA
jgi:predicted O-methyltransferase YrrM